jgi:hypothetical protein
LFGGETPTTLRRRALVSMPAGEQYGDILDHLREQWHLLVQRDNLLGPRHTIPAVCEQITVLE